MQEQTHYRKRRHRFYPLEAATSVLSAYLAALSETLTNKTITAPTVTTLTLDGERMSIGASAHASPGAGDWWFETDTGILWNYGTYASASRWVSPPYTIGLLSPTSAGFTASYVGMAAANSSYDIYIESLDAIVHVVTTNDGTKYWTVNVRSITTTTTPATGAGSLLGGITTSASSPDTWLQLSASIDAVVDSSASAVMLDIIKTSTAGTLHASGTMLCRLVHA